MRLPKLLKDAWETKVHDLRQAFDGNLIFDQPGNADERRAVRIAGWLQWTKNLDKAVPYNEWRRWANLEKQSMFDEIDVLISGVGRDRLYQTVADLPSVDVQLPEEPSTKSGFCYILLLRAVSELINIVSPLQRKAIYDDEHGVELEWRCAFLKSISQLKWRRMSWTSQRSVLSELYELEKSFPSIPYKIRVLGMPILDALIARPGTDRNPTYPALLGHLVQYCQHAHSRLPTLLNPRDGQPSTEEIAEQLRSAQENTPWQPRRNPYASSTQHKVVEQPSSEEQYLSTRDSDFVYNPEDPVYYKPESLFGHCVQDVKLACQAKGYQKERMWLWVRQLDFAAQCIKSWPVYMLQQVLNQLANVVLEVQIGQNLPDPIVGKGPDDNDLARVLRQANTGRVLSIRLFEFKWKIPEHYIDPRPSLRQTLQALHAAILRSAPHKADKYTRYELKPRLRHWSDWREEDLTAVMQELQEATRKIAAGGTIPTGSSLAYALQRADRHRLRRDQVNSLESGQLSRRQAVVYGGVFRGDSRF